MNPEENLQNKIQQDDTQAKQQQLKLYTIISYGCFVAIILFYIMPVIAVIIAYIKRKDATDSIYYSHLQYIITTFWIGILFCLISLLFATITVFLLSLLQIGNFGYFTMWNILIFVWATFITYNFILGIWLLYRLIKGIIFLVDGKKINYHTWL